MKRLSLTIAASALLALTACGAPQQSSRTDVNVENAMSLGAGHLESAMNSTNTSTAVSALAQFCRTSKINLGTVHSKLRAAGYLELGSRARDSITLWSKKGGVVFGTAQRGKNPMCMVFVNAKETSVAKVDAQLRAKMSKDINRLNFKIPRAEGAWTMSSNPKNVFMLFSADGQKKSIAYITG